MDEEKTDFETGNQVLVDCVEDNIDGRRGSIFGTRGGFGLLGFERVVMELD
jgi:hypothetical protein